MESENNKTEHEKIEKMYVCVNCGRSAPTLYKHFSSDVLKLCHCSQVMKKVFEAIQKCFLYQQSYSQSRSYCGKIVDEYIEVEITVIFIDVLLQKTEAYRHILYNTQIQSLWKMATIFLLCDAYRMWVVEREFKPHVGKGREELVYLELEWDFYLVCLKALVGNAVHFLLLAVVGYVVNIIFNAKNESFPWKKLFISLIVTSFGKIFFIPSILWRQGSEIGHITDFLITIFVLVSHIQAVKVILSSSTCLSTFQVLFTYAVQTVLEVLLTMVVS